MLGMLVSRVLYTASITIGNFFVITVNLTPCIFDGFQEKILCQEG